MVCKSTTQSHEFGLCDDPPPSTLPAYIDTTDQAKWIAHVNNLALKEVTFKAIDNCVEIFRPDGSRESRCDGLLTYERNLIFVELKDRGTGGWVTKGRTQLTITINKFKENHDITQFDTVEAYVCNKQTPLVVTSINSEAQRFRDDTGLLLKANRVISIEN